MAMKLGELVGVVIVLTFIWQAGKPPEAPVPTELLWYQGGGLEDDLMADWRVATDHARLATAADMVVVALSENHPDWQVDDYRPYAEELVQCLNGAMASPESLGDFKAVDSLKVADMAAACILLLEWR